MGPIFSVSPTNHPCVQFGGDKDNEGNETRQIPSPPTCFGLYRHDQLIRWSHPALAMIRLREPTTQAAIASRMGCAGYWQGEPDANNEVAERNSQLKLSRGADGYRLYCRHQVFHLGGSTARQGNSAAIQLPI